MNVLGVWAAPTTISHVKKFFMETTLHHVEYTLNASYEENTFFYSLKCTQRVEGVPSTLRAKMIFK